MKTSARPMVMGLLVACAGGKGSEVGEVCAQYLTCVGAASPAEGALYEATYGEGSACWSDDQQAALCEAACADSLVALDDAWPLVEACDVGDGFTAAEVFTVAGSYSVTVTEVDGDPPCDDITGGDGGVDMTPQSGVGFTLDGRVSFDGSYSQAIDALDCELIWGGFECPAFEGVLGENRLDGSFSPDLLSVTLRLDADSSDQDPETLEEVDCTYHLELLGTPG